MSLTTLSRFTSVPVGRILVINNSRAIFYGPEKLQELQMYGLAASLQLSQRQISTEPHSGQLNLTHLSFGIMCLLQQLQTGSASDVDM
jgi:hypothetical protein